jgi:hypothetical protein
MRRCIDFLRISGSGSIVMFPIYSSGAPFSISLTKRNPGNPNHARPSIIQLVPPSLVLSTVWLSSLTSRNSRHRLIVMETIREDRQSERKIARHRILSRQNDISRQRHPFGYSNTCQYSDEVSSLIQTKHSSLSLIY